MGGTDSPNSGGNDMPVNTTTTDRVIVTMGKFREENSDFWHIAAHYARDDPKCIEAEKQLKAAANRLMQSLLGLVLET